MKLFYDIPIHDSLFDLLPALYVIGEDGTNNIENEVEVDIIIHFLSF